MHSQGWQGAQSRIKADVMQYTRQLLNIMARLRNPQGGCPWDLEQTYATIVPYTIEEAYEVAEAIAQGDMEMLKAELGDLLFQVVFYAQMASEDGLFDFEDVAQLMVEKMIRRHPHVFGEAEITSAEAQTANWEAIKQSERTEKDQHSLMDDIPQALPALLRAHKLQKRAASVGFDWPDATPVLEKIEEELDEVREAMKSGDSEHVAEEIGDLLFATVNLARKSGMRAEETLRSANAKFEKRFRYIEQVLEAKGEKAEDKTLEELEELWVEAKKALNN